MDKGRADIAVSLGKPALVQVRYPPLEEIEAADQI